MLACCEEYMIQYVLGGYYQNELIYMGYWDSAWHILSTQEVLVIIIKYWELEKEFTCFYI